MFNCVLQRRGDVVQLMDVYIQWVDALSPTPTLVELSAAQGSTMTALDDPQTISDLLDNNSDSIAGREYCQLRYVSHSRTRGRPFLKSCDFLVLKQKVFGCICTDHILCICCL